MDADVGNQSRFRHKRLVLTASRGPFLVLAGSWAADCVDITHYGAKRDGRDAAVRSRIQKIRVSVVVAHQFDPEPGN